MDDKNARLAESKYIILKKRQKKTRITGAILIAIGLVVLLMFFAIREFAILAPAAAAIVLGLVTFIRSFVNKKLLVLGDGDKEETYKIIKRDPEDKLMLCQHAALFVYHDSNINKKRYMKKLTRYGLDRQEAEKLFEFECGVLRNFNKPYLLRPDFTDQWFFGLAQPLFQTYPKGQDDILKERFLTVGELCKIVDEAEWHYRNNRENPLPDDVWIEILTWRKNGPGGEFGIRYIEMISEATGVPVERIGVYTANEARRLNIYKWS